jgi:hypothetical protein
MGEEGLGNIMQGVSFFKVHYMLLWNYHNYIMLIQNKKFNKVEIQYL